MRNSTLQCQGAANALLEEARSLADETRRTVARFREIGRAYERVSNAINAAMNELDMPHAGGSDDLSRHG